MVAVRKIPFLIIENSFEWKFIRGSDEFLKMCFSFQNIQANYYSDQQLGGTNQGNIYGRNVFIHKDATVGNGNIFKSNIYVDMGVHISDGNIFDDGVTVGAYTSVGKGNIITTGMNIPRNSNIGDGNII